MRIAYIIRSSARNRIGGDFVQFQSTADAVISLGVQVETYFADEEIPYHEFDLLHFFNIIRPADILRHMQRTTTPIVVSTIFVDYAAALSRRRQGPIASLSIWLHEVFGEYAKYVFRVMSGSERTICIQYLLWGHRRSVDRVAKNAALLLPNSISEANRLSAYLHRRQNNIRYVPNGINPSVFGSAIPNEAFVNYVVCVGLIEPRKNQLKVIRALGALGYKALIIGSASRNANYYHDCLEAAKENVTFLGQTSQKQLAEIFKAAKVHVLASYFETTGLVSLEAAFCGCNIVTTNSGDQSEYFSGISFQCDPDSEESIRLAIQSAYNSPRDYFRTSELIESHFTWELAAKATVNAYKEVLVDP